MLDQTRFVIRICLGWLFEHPNVPKEYYNYRQHRKQLPMLQGPASKKFDVAPMFESIVVASCPFLSDFRVAIMPMKREKQVSRTGQYRHIRTKFAGEPIVTKKEVPTDNQGKLLDAFLHSQSTSMRKVIEFIIERVTSAVVKDFQFEYLIPKKKDVNEAVKLLKVTDEVRVIFEVHHEF